MYSNIQFQYIPHCIQSSINIGEYTGECICPSSGLLKRLSFHSCYQHPWWSSGQVLVLSFLQPQYPEQLWFLVFLNFGVLDFHFTLSYTTSFQLLLLFFSLRKLEMICICYTYRYTSHPEGGTLTSVCCITVFMGIWLLFS